MNYVRVLQHGVRFVYNESLFVLYFLYSVALFLVLVPFSYLMHYAPVFWYGLALVTMLIGILVEGVVTRGFKYSNINANIRFVGKRYVNLLFIAVFVGILILIGNFLIFLPYGIIGAFAVWFIVSLMFLFMYQEVIYGNTKPGKVIRNCLKYFKKSFVSVLTTALISWIASGVVMLFFAFPFIRYLMISMKNTFSIPMHTPVFWFSAFLFLLGLAASKLISIGIVTSAYFEIKKKCK